MRLVLWDVDGTLVDSAGIGPDAFPLAFERTVGRPAAELPEMAGRTDHEIGLETLERNGIEEPERLWPEFARQLAAALAELEPAMRERGRALPGAHDAIAALAEASGVVQSLLTGNLKPNAAVKLGAFGLLLPALDLEIGAYGSDDRHRPALVSIARERAAARHGQAPEQTILIGDTPLDVAAGRAGARASSAWRPAATAPRRSTKPVPTPCSATCSTPRRCWPRCSRRRRKGRTHDVAAPAPVPSPRVAAAFGCPRCRRG